MTVVELWTDGSGTKAELPGGWAFVLVARKGDEVVARKEVFGGVSFGGSNNRMELTAALMGLRSIERPVEVTVYTDSEYLARAFPEGWLGKWDARSWHGVKNADLWSDLRVQVKRLRFVEWQHVPGHAGLPENERADELAGAARKAIKALLEGTAEAHPEVIREEPELTEATEGCAR